ncbi:histidine kinase [Qingshengfaniella alkalisoli]|uniref:histidine kinase n=2 Tax=Qingshengfaniella alkalisoli TaxID=2599296 RepID=A0A5B8J029_9RHOB|nr:histidine kinase [Qingshengfaniella alkalisoli]
MVLLASIPLVLAVAAIALLVAFQERQLAEREIRTLETQLVAAKEAELRNYLSIARNAIINIYGRAAPDDEAAKLAAGQILSSMTFGADGYFFVFDYDGNNLVAPRRTELIGRNWSGLTDTHGTPITDELIKIARNGGGYHSFEWEKPSTGETAQMVSYVIGLQDWQWVIGTGIFVDDIIEAVAATRAEVQRRIRRTFIYIGAIALGALLMVYSTGLGLNIRDRRAADRKQHQLTQRIVDAQEEERSRVARELHDSISQILVGIRYALELARRQVSSGDARAETTLQGGVSHLNVAIHEVRRISRDLRPAILDDLGLGPALQALTEDFSKRTGIETQFQTVVFHNRLDKDARIALYRIAQEALTNVERHSGATQVEIKLYGHKHGGTLWIRDNGCGIRDTRNGPGLGLRNMQERVEQLDGEFSIDSSRDGTTIEARVPLSHMLTPESKTGRNA